MPRYIDADALGIGYANQKVFNSEEYARGWNSAIEIINSAPTVSPDDVRGAGKWTRHVLKNANTPWGYDCSACGEWFVIGDDTAERYNYCPNCEARMTEVSDYA